MKYLNVVLTVIAILLVPLVGKIYTTPNSNFIKVGEKELEMTFLDQRSGRLYTYSPKHTQYPATIKVINLKSGAEWNCFTKDKIEK